MAERSGTVETTVTFDFGEGEAACLDVIEQVVAENPLLGVLTRDDAAGTGTASFTLNVAVDPDEGEFGSYRVVRE